MSFAGWCACHEHAARQHAAATYQAVVHQRFRREAAAYRARLFAEVERKMQALGGAIARDIREWRVQA